jgi:hypothetical protein
MELVGRRRDEEPGEDKQRIEIDESCNHVFYWGI